MILLRRQAAVKSSRYIIWLTADLIPSLLPLFPVLCRALQGTVLYTVDVLVSTVSVNTADDIEILHDLSDTYDFLIYTNITWVAKYGYSRCLRY